MGWPVRLAALTQRYTNLLLRSQEFDNAAWTKTDVTVTANAATAPDGTTTADLMTEGTAGTAGTLQTAASGADVLRSDSIFLKRGNTDWVRVRLVGTGSNAINAWFNLATGAPGSITMGGSSTLGSSRVEPAGDGWFRCCVRGLSASDPSPSLQFMSASADGNAARVNNATYYAWGGQAVAGAAPGPYIPTTTAAVTRYL